MTLLSPATLSLVFISAQAAFAQASLQVTVKNIRQIEGTVRVGLFDNADDFLERAMYGEIGRVSGNSVTVSFSDIPDGTYAISVIHDKNNNGELDTNILGIPKEGFAFGNNAMGMFGPPSFEKASVKIGDGPLEQVLYLKHF